MKDINEMIIKCIRKYCDNINSMCEDCENNCVLVDKYGECKYNEAIDHIRNVDDEF